MKKKEINIEVEDALIDLYQNVKIRNQDEVNSPFLSFHSQIESMDANKLTQERDNLKKVSPLTLIQYIKTSIDMLIDLKVEERLDNIKKQTQHEENQNLPQDYESLLIKLEADIRQHIRIEHQLKLHSDNLQMRIDELENENDEFLKRTKLSGLLTDKSPISSRKGEGKDKKDQEIITLKSENANLKKIIKSYEEKNLRFSEMEKKFTNQLFKREQDLKSIEEKYREKLKVLSRKLLNFEEMISMNSTLKSLRNVTVTNVKDDEDREVDHAKSTERKGAKIIVERKRTDNKMKIYRQLGEKSKIKIDSQRNNSTSISQNKIDLEKSSYNTSFLAPAKDVQKPDKRHLHCRQASMEVKPSVLPCEKDKTGPESMNKTITNLKSLGLTKGVTFNNHKQQTNCISSLKHKRNLKQEKAVMPSNVIIHPGGVPCYNNINIYTSNVNQNIKAGDIHLKQYIFNQINSKTGSGSKD